MKIFLLKLNESDSDPLVEQKFIKYISNERAKLYFAIKNDFRKSICLYSHLFAKYILAKNTNLKIKDLEILSDANKKPFLKNHPEFFFSISHSGEYISFVFDDKNISIDIEKIRKVNIEISKRFFLDNDLVKLDKCNDIIEKQLEFLKIWTQKECIVKYYNYKIFDIKKIDISKNNNNLYTKIFKKSIISIYSKNKVEMDIIEINKADIDKFLLISN